MNLEYDIIDNRTTKEFIGVTFSGYKKTAVHKDLVQSILGNKIEVACNWVAELVCAGHFEELWDIILFIMGKHIHLSNPRIPIYINMRCKKFKEIVQTYIGNEIDMRNNQTIRTLFTEIICVLCVSEKYTSLEPIEITSEEDFSLTYMSRKFDAPNINYGLSVCKPSDPKEIYIPINELAYHIESKTSLLKGCYWIEWIIEYDRICRKKKENLYCEQRDFVIIQNKLRLDVIWIVWELLYKSVPNNNKDLKTTIEALMELYSLKFSQTTKRKHRYILYFAMELIICNPDFRKPIVHEDNTKLITSICKGINKVYSTISNNIYNLRII
jgi:hypothetical protein